MLDMFVVFIARLERRFAVITVIYHIQIETLFIEQIEWANHKVVYLGCSQIDSSLLWYYGVNEAAALIYKQLHGPVYLAATMQTDNPQHL